MPAEPALAARRLYVYYRVAGHLLAATVQAVQLMQVNLTTAHPGLRAELLRRPDLDQGTITLMEVYAGSVSTALLAALAQASAALPQPRHNELFEALVQTGSPPTAA